MVAIGAALAWQLTAELIELHLLLVVADWLTPKVSPLYVATVGGTTFRLYQDTRPRTGKIAGLQEGLVLGDAVQEMNRHL